MLKAVLKFAIAGGLMLAAPLARAQGTWPDHPVRVVVGQPAGSSTDIIARVFTDAFAKTFKQPFIIDNKPGANAIIATDFVKNAPADGYTLLFTYAAAQVVNQSIYKSARYDGAKDFAAIGQIGAQGNFLVVPASLPVNDLQEFIAYVKAKPPNSLSYGSWGVGSGGHLSMEVIKQKAGLEMQHVPYKSVIASLQDMLAGQIQVAFASAASSVPLIKDGKLKALAISAPTRSNQLPDCKTMTEQGVPFELTAWYGVFAPAGTPQPIVDALNKEINRLIVAPEMQQQWNTLAFDAMPTKTAAEFAATVKSDVVEWGAIAKANHIQIE